MRLQFLPWCSQSVHTAAPAMKNSTNNNVFKRKDKMKEEKLNPDGTTVPEQVIKQDQSNIGSNKKNNKRKHNKKFINQERTNDSASSAVSDSKTAKTTGLNVFYPMFGGYLAGRHKYNVSHYTINLSPMRLNSASSDPDRYYNTEITPTNTPGTIKLGGSQFHRRVMAAATQANAKFYVTTGNLIPLMNAFYGHMYNSRILYALLCTAWRCQSQVNVIDEDQLYFSPMLNDHESKYFSQGWSNTTFADETDMATFTTNTVRQNYCFSDPTSNGVWANSVVTPILQFTRLTDGWKRWIEEKFMRTYAVDPTDFNSTPRFLVFWPTAAGVTGSGTEGLVKYSSYEDFDSDTTAFTSNASIFSLIGHINALAAEQSAFLRAYPQLELMWEYLGMSSSNTSFTRDLDAKSLPVVHSYSISKLIRSSATAYSKAITGTNKLRMFYQDARNNLIISRDPVAKEYSFKTFEMASSSRTVANLTYLDRVELDEGDFAISAGQIAPISLQVVVYNSGNGTFLWRFPLVLLFTEGSSVINPPTGTFNNSSGNLVQAITELHCITGMESAVLPRIRLRIDQQFYGSLLLPSNYSLNDLNLPYYNLKDYIVPPLEADGWIDSYLDEVLTK